MYNSEQKRQWCELNNGLWLSLPQNEIQNGLYQNKQTVVRIQNYSHQPVTCGAWTNSALKQHTLKKHSIPAILWVWLV